MCVIAVVEDDKKRPSGREINAMWEANDHGGGVAWREKGKVFWKKGLTLPEMHQYLRELPVPFVSHFRISSIEKPPNKLLTHPFLVSKDTPLLLEGSTKGQVLFHNGHWGEWESQSKTWLAQSAGKIQPPLGKWSDSRAMAFWAAHFGLGIFEGKPWGIDERVIILGPGPEDLDYFGKDWKTYNGYVVSNEWWLSKLKREPSAINPPRQSPNHIWTPGAAQSSVRNGGTETSTLSGSTSKETPKTETKDFGGKDSVEDSKGKAQGGPSVTTHPFVKAAEEYETALLAYSQRDSKNGKRLGSKTQKKKKAKKFEEACFKYPLIHKQWKEGKKLEHIHQLERIIHIDQLTEQNLSDLGQAVPRIM